MFAKLFNNISPRNLLNAILVLLLMASSFWLYPVSQWQWFPKTEWQAPLAGPLISFISFTLLSILAPLIFAESQNRRHRFEGQYLSLLIAGMLFWLWIYPLNAGPQIWSLLLFGLILASTIPLLRPDSNSSALSYTAGLSISIASFINGESVVLILIPLGIMAAVRRLNGRTVLALVLGYGSGLYFAFSLDFLFDWSLIATWLSELQGLDFFHFNNSHKRLATLIPVGLFLVISILVNLSQGHHYNNEQRKEINYWIFLQLMGVTGFFLFKNSNFWLGLCLWPATALGTLAIQGLQNRWLKDGLLILPLLAYLSTFFV